MLKINIKKGPAKLQDLSFGKMKKVLKEVCKIIKQQEILIPRLPLRKCKIGILKTIFSLNIIQKAQTNVNR